LNLFEVGDDVDIAQRDDSEELCAGLHVLTDTQRACSDDAMDRRNDRRIVYVEARSAFHCLGAF
jgi:hypothetical protein